MPADFVTLAEVKRSLRYLSTETDDDANLTLLISAASRVIANYLKDAAGPYLDPSATVPSEIKVATTMLVGVMSNSPDGANIEPFADGRLPANILVLIQPLRRPTLA